MIQKRPIDHQLFKVEKVVVTTRLEVMLRFLSWKKKRAEQIAESLRRRINRLRQNKRRRTEGVKEEKERFVKSHIDRSGAVWQLFFYIVLIMVVSGLAQNLGTAQKRRFSIFWLQTERLWGACLPVCYILTP